MLVKKIRYQGLKGEEYNLRISNNKTMPLFTYLSRLLCICLLCFAVNSQANPASHIYTISQITIEGRGNSAADARNSAVSSGETQAFTTLLKRITPESNHTQLPPFSADEISRMVQSMDIHNEKVTPSYYSAIVSFSFNPAMVNDSLKNRNITIINTQTKPIIVLVSSSSNEIDLSFSANNSYNLWLEAWKKQKNQSGLVEYQLVNQFDQYPTISAYIQRALNRTNQEMLSDPAQTALLAQEIAALKEAHGSTTLIAAVAYITKTLGSEEISSYVYDLSDISIPSTPLFFTANTSMTTNPVTPAAPSPYEELTNLISSHLNTQWKQVLIQQQSNASSIKVIAPISDLGQLRYIQQQLATIPDIQSVRILELSTYSAVLEITGNIKDTYFTNHLAQRSLYLQQTAEDTILTIGQPPSTSSPSLFN